VAEVKEIKDVLKLVLSGYKVYGLSMADGKIGFEDIGNLMVMIPHIQPAFDGVDQIPAEFKDMDAAEAQELTDYVKSELNVEDSKVGRIIDSALSLVIAGYKLYLAINEKPEAEAA
jgi:hypothetical protein